MYPHINKTGICFKGGTNLIEIYFQDTLDAAKVYTNLKEYKRKKSIHNITLFFDKANLITAKCESCSHHVLKALLIPTLTNYILKVKEDQLMLAIISNFFYYHDYEEQQQIISLAHSISEGEISGIPDLHKVIARKNLIEQALEDFLNRTVSFSLESFIKFRLKAYYEILFQLIETAIDEYKMEQEYQSFIQTLRELLVKRESKLVCLHLLYQDQIFRFFNENFTELTPEEIKLLLDRKLIVHQPIYIDSSIIVPLVSIAPKVIHLYSNDVDHNIIQSILNIFQERVKIFSRKEFFDKSLIK